MDSDGPSREREQSPNVPTVHRRRFLAVGGGVGAALLAGCTSGDGPADGGDGGPEEDGADFRLLVSDAPADIDDFDRLDVTLDSARIFDGGAEDDGDEPAETDEEGGGAGEDAAGATDGDGTAAEGEHHDEEPTEDHQETEDGTGEGTETATPAGDDESDDGADDEAGEDETDEADDPEDGDGSGAGGDATATETATATAEAPEDGEDADGRTERRRGFYVLDLEDATVDLTQVVGDRAVPVFDGELSAGRYQKVELHVADVEGVVDGDVAEVKVPSGKLQITKPFEVRAGEAVDFVFDINVVKRGREASYNLQPVISESGVAGEDVEVEEVDGGQARGGREAAGEGDERTAGDDGAGSDDEGGQGDDGDGEADGADGDDEADGADGGERSNGSADPGGDAAESDEE